MPGHDTRIQAFFYIVMQSSHFDKMPNEPPEKALHRTKIQFGGFRGPSRTIRKIHMDTDSSGIQSLMKELRLNLLSE